MFIREDFYIFKANYYGIISKDGVEARLIQVTEILNQESPIYTAYPSKHFGDFSAREGFIGKGQTERDALDDCLNKIEGVNWDELFD